MYGSINAPGAKVHENRIIGLALTIAILSSACIGGSGDSGIDPSVPATATQPASGVGNTGPIDLACNGGAFPNDPDFRQILCDVQNAELNVMVAKGTFDPAWGPRVSQAILKQSTDRAAAVAELEVIIAEMNAAA